MTRAAMNDEFLRYFRCPPVCARFTRLAENPAAKGFFRFGPDAIAYGAFDQANADVGVALADADELVEVGEDHCSLPFDPEEVITNLRRERYVTRQSPPLVKQIVRQLYYLLRPAFPVAFRRHLQRLWLNGWQQIPFPKWPVDASVDHIFERMMLHALEAHSGEEIPFIWFWPDARSSCAVMTHDVETAFGLDFIDELMNVNDGYGIKSSFQLIPAARYTVTKEILKSIKSRGFEANVHDLRHNGHLFDDYVSFKANAAKINYFARLFESAGFRSGALYRNQEWYDAFQFDYDMSVPNVGHLDPQHGGCCTVMPYFVGNVVELPVTMTQDYTLFNVFHQYDLDLWQEQLSIVRKRNGMASFIVHPDYIQTPKTLDVYKQLLACLDEMRNDDCLWIALPGEVNRWWRKRDKMSLVWTNNQWQIEGEGAERARVAYARIDRNTVTYRVT